MKNKHLYSIDWNEKIRPAILRRDAYKCTVCKALNHSKGYYEANGSYIECDMHMQLWAVANGKKLVTVHLQVIHRDQNPSNNEPENLSSMCPKHHFEFDAAFNRVKRLSSGRSK